MCHKWSNCLISLVNLCLMDGYKNQTFSFLPIIIDVILIRIDIKYKFVIDKDLFNLNMLSSFDETFIKNGI